MKTIDLNKGDYFRIKNDETVYEIVGDKKQISVKCVNLDTDMYVHLFLNLEVSEVLSEQEKEEINEFYGI